MQGLLDFLKTPAGQGLLSGAFGMAAGARRGTPWNNLGRGGLAGLAGYSNAIDAQKADEEAQFTKQYRQMQMDEMTRKVAQQKAQENWWSQLPAAMQPKLQGTDAVTNQIAAENAEFGDFGVQRLNELHTPLAISYGPDKQKLQQFMLDPASPFKDDLIKKQLIPDPPKYMTVKPGETVVSEKDPTKPLFSLAPTPKDAPDKVQQYEYAKKNGYKGSFTDFLAIVPIINAAAMAPLRGAQIDSINARDAYTLPQPQPAAPPSTAGQFTVTVNGTTYAFPDKKSLNNFKLNAGIR